MQMRCGRRTSGATSHNAMDIARFLDGDPNFVRFCGLIGTMHGYMTRRSCYLEVHGLCEDTEVLGKDITRGHMGRGNGGMCGLHGLVNRAPTPYIDISDMGMHNSYKHAGHDVLTL